MLDFISLRFKQNRKKKKNCKVHLKVTDKNLHWEKVCSTYLSQWDAASLKEQSS